MQGELKRLSSEPRGSLPRPDKPSRAFSLPRLAPGNPKPTTKPPTTKPEGFGEMLWRVAGERRASLVGLGKKALVRRNTAKVDVRRSQGARQSKEELKQRLARQRKQSAGAGLLVPPFAVDDAAAAAGAANHSHNDNSNSSNPESARSFRRQRTDPGWFEQQWKEMDAMEARLKGLGQERNSTNHSLSIGRPSDPAPPPDEGDAGERDDWNDMTPPPPPPLPAPVVCAPTPVLPHHSSPTHGTPLLRQFTDPAWFAERHKELDEMKHKLTRVRSLRQNSDARASAESAMELDDGAVPPPPEEPKAEVEAVGGEGEGEEGDGYSSEGDHWSLSKGRSESTPASFQRPHEMLRVGSIPRAHVFAVHRRASASRKKARVLEVKQARQASESQLHFTDRDELHDSDWLDGEGQL